MMDAGDTLTDDLAEEMAYRERATALLDELAHRARVALRNANIPLNVYFIVPESGDTILTLCAAVDQEDWQEIKSVVSSIVQRSLGLEPRQYREVMSRWATPQTTRLERG